MQIHEIKHTDRKRYIKTLANSPRSPERLLNSLHHRSPQATIKPVVPHIVKMDAVGAKNLMHAIPQSLMPPEENTVRVTAKGLEITVDLDDSGGAFLVGKAAPATASANLTNGHPFSTGFEEATRETKYIQCNHDRRTGRPSAYIISSNMKDHNVRATRNNPGHDGGG